MINKYKSGFTLIEILIVVLIIGLLASIALPGYRKAVEKSKVADALTTMQAVAKSEHGFYLAKNTYTKDFADLDISLIDKDGNKADDESFETVNYTFTLQKNNIKARRSNGEYTLYKMYEDNDIFCLPTEHYICEQYDWGMNRNACENGLGGAWSNRKTKCYNNPKERCEANNSEWFDNTYGYKNYCGYFVTDEVEVGEFEKCVTFGSVYAVSCNRSTFTGEGSQCIGGNASCMKSQFNRAECQGRGTNSCQFGNFTNNSACIATGAYACNYSTFTAGSKCYSENIYDCNYSRFYKDAECVSGTSAGGTAGGCTGNTFKEGSKCIANNQYACRGENTSFEAGSYCIGNAENSCTGDYFVRLYNFQGTCVANAPGTCAITNYFSYSGSGCCEGKYCAANTPKCVCGIDPNTNKHATSC